MYLVRIALRNLFRRKGRTFLIAGILALAVFLFLWLESFMIGFMDVSFGNIIDFETPHIEVAREGFFEEAQKGRELPLAETFTPGEELLEELEARDGFVALTPILEFSADFIAGRHQFPVRVRSIDPQSFGEVFRNQEYLIDGDFVEAGDPGIVIGRELARFFNLEVGDFYTLRFQDTGGSFNTMQGEVKGIVNVPHPEMNLGTVFVARDQAQAALGLEEGKISQVMVRMENRDMGRKEAKKLANILGNRDLKVRSYREGAEILVHLETWGFIETYFILALFLLVGAIGIISVVVLAAIERVKEIGMMKAMGLKESEIVRIFILEAGGIGAVGGLLGCILGAIVIFFMKTYGIDMEAFFDLSEFGVPMVGKIYGAWNPISFFLIFVFVIILSMVASLIPSYWAARKDPVVAIRDR